MKLEEWAGADLPGLGRSPGEGNGYPHQYSCLENPMEGGTSWTVFLPGQSHAWRSLVGYSYSPRSRKESDTTERLTLTYFCRSADSLSFQVLRRQAIYS